MIVYGWNSKVLKESPFPGQTCVSCGAQESHILVTGSYAHIFWIPIFPYKKSLTIVCSHCSMETKPKDASPEMKEFAKQLKSTVRLPIYMFAGTAIIAVLIAFFAIQGFMKDQQIEKYLDEPQVNDIYYIYDATESTAYKYTIQKVVDVQGDSVSLTVNSFQYNYKPTTLDPQDGFYNITFTLHKDDIQSLYEGNEISEVMRGFASGSGFDRVIEFTEEDFLQEEDNN
jgi:hypothetical protein